MHYDQTEPLKMNIQQEDLTLTPTAWMTGRTSLMIFGNSPIFTLNYEPELSSFGKC